MITESITAKGDIVAVVRSAGERTLDVCVALLQRDVPKSRIHVIREVPFEAALRRCYEIGAESGAKWMLTVDADVLLLPGGVASLLEAAEALPAHYAQVEGRIFDKVYGIYRPAGHRIYRTAVLEQAMAAIPAPGTQLRPETATLEALGTIGFPSRRHFLVAGIHDFEQYYLDLYRKACVFAHKHNYRVSDLIARCLALQAEDADFKVILKGFCDGLLLSGPVRIDAGHYADNAANALDELGLEEKGPFDLPQEKDIDAWLKARLEGEPPVRKYRDTPAPEHPPEESKLQRLASLRKERGLASTFTYASGAALVRIGDALKRL